MNEPRQALSGLSTVLTALVAIDVMYLTAHPEVPLLKDAGVTLVSDPAPNMDVPFSQEEYRDIPTILSKDKRTGLRTARNRDLVAWAAAESLVRAKDGRTGSPARVSIDPAAHVYQAVLPLPTGGAYAPGTPTPYRAQHRVTFVLGLFDGDKERDLSHRSLEVLLAALTRIDIDYLKAHPETPLLYQSGCFYQEEPPGQEDWQDVPTSLRMRAADCEDLACWRAAELNVRYAVKATPKFIYEKRPDGSYLYHIQTQLPDGRVEDPSRMLGMR